MALCVYWASMLVMVARSGRVAVPNHVSDPTNERRSLLNLCWVISSVGCLSVILSTGRPDRYGVGTVVTDGLDRPAE